MTLAYFKPGADTIIQVDASGRGLCAVLMQAGKPTHSRQTHSVTVRHITRTLSKICSMLPLGASDSIPTSTGRGSR